jgi:hypothetical protein
MPKGGRIAWASVIALTLLSGGGVALSAATATGTSSSINARNAVANLLASSRFDVDEVDHGTGPNPVDDFDITFIGEMTQTDIEGSPARFQSSG